MTDLICALGIPNVGYRSAKNISEHFEGNINKMLDILEECNQIRIPLIGKLTTVSITYFIKHNRHIIKDLLRYVSIINKPIKQKTPNKMRIAITGELSAKTRQIIELEIHNVGMVVDKTVTKETSYLIVGRNPGKKKDIATKFKIPILTETEWEKLRTSFIDKLS